MKSILLDMNMSVDWIEFLQTHGFSTVRWSSVGNPHASDEEIMDWAQTNHFIVITQDLDFGTLLALTRAEAPSVIQMRGNLVMPESSGNFLLDTLSRYQSELEHGALIVIDEPRVRVRVLPFT